MLSDVQINKVHCFQLENNLKNESAAIGMMLIAYERLQYIVKELEKKAHEGEEWKTIAKNKGDIPKKTKGGAK